MQQLKAGKTVKVRQFRYGSNIIIEENRSKTKSKNKNERIEMGKTSKFSHKIETVIGASLRLNLKK